MKIAALVTGGAKRIGREISLALADLGYDIAINYNSTEPKEIIKEIKAKGVDCKAYKCDLGKEEEIAGLIDKVKKDFPHLFLLVNNASIFEESTIAQTDFELFNRHIDINLKAPFFLSKNFAKCCNKGEIINIIDTKVTKNKTKYSAYLLSKKALAEFTKMAAKEFAPNIRVNAIAPGLILPPDGQDNTYLEKLAKNVPLQKIGNPEYIVKAVKYFIDNDYVTGQFLFIDGGDSL